MEEQGGGSGGQGHLQWAYACLSRSSDPSGWLEVKWSWWSIAQLFFSSDSFVHVKCHDAEPGNPWMLKREAN